MTNNADSDTRELNLARWCIERLGADAARGDRPALTFARNDGTTQCWTYAEVWARVQRIARGLLDGGLEPGDPVLVRLPHSPDAAFAFFGTVLAGLVAVPAGPPLDAEAATRLAEDSGAMALITTWELRFDGFDGATLLTGYLDLLDGPGPLPLTNADDANVRVDGALLSHRALAARAWTPLDAAADAPLDVTPHAEAALWPCTSGVGLIDVWAAGGHALLTQALPGGTDPPRRVTLAGPLAGPSSAQRQIGTSWSSRRPRRAPSRRHSARRCPRRPWCSTTTM